MIIKHLKHFSFRDLFRGDFSQVIVELTLLILFVNLFEQRDPVSIPRLCIPR